MRDGLTEFGSDWHCAMRNIRSPMLTVPNRPRPLFGFTVMVTVPSSPETVDGLAIIQSWSPLTSHVQSFGPSTETPYVSPS